MFSIFVFLILGLNHVLGEDNDFRNFQRQDIQDAHKIWKGPGSPGGPWGPGSLPGQGWGKPPIPEPIPVQNDVLGVEKMFRAAYPLPASSAIDVVNVGYYDHSVCSPEPASYVKDLTINGSFPFPVTCNGITTHVIPWAYNATINGQTVLLTIPKLYKVLGWLNGNLIDIATGGISTPICEGSFLWKIVWYAANSQYECSSTGLTGQTIVYTVKVITGPCQSVCWLDKGWTTISPPVNNLGSLTGLGNS